jgi:predicted nicotinamide N-methyase
MDMQEEALMDNEWFVEMKIELVTLHNLRLNEEMNSFLDQIDTYFVEFDHYEEIGSTDECLIILLMTDISFDCSIGKKRVVAMVIQ